MALGRRRESQQQEMWVAAGDLPKSSGHAFNERLNALLRQADFDRQVESLCQPYYAAQAGRPSIPPGVYFRMLLVGYFEGIGSQRGIAWRCGDSLSLRSFLGLALTESPPDHSSLTRVRDRLPLEIHQQVFQLVLRLAAEHKLLSGKQVGVDATTLEANAAMKSIVRRDSGEDWRTYVKGLMRQEGEIGEDDDPSDEELRRFDRRRKSKKKVSNQDWVSPTDEDSRIAKMKDGRTRLAYKGENVVDLETDLVVSAEVHCADRADSKTLVDGVMQAQTHLNEAGLEAQIEEVAADKGYHAAAALESAESVGLRTYIPEPKRHHRRRWKGKSPCQRRAVENNRRRVRRRKGRRLQRRRSEVVERTFAHMCETGGARRTWLRGLEKVNKRWLIQAAARNLGLIMRAAFGIGTARGLQGAAGLALRLWIGWWLVLNALKRWKATFRDLIAQHPSEPPPTWKLV